MECERCKVKISWTILGRDSYVVNSKDYCYGCMIRVTSMYRIKYDEKRYDGKRN